MSKNEKSAVAQEITNKICEVFGINPSEVSVNHRCMTTEDGHEMEVVDCSVNLTGDNNIKSIEQKIVIPSKDEVKEKVAETWEDVYNKVKEAFKDERVVNAQNQLKSAFGRLLEAVYQNTDETDTEDEFEELVDDSECGEEKCCQCGTPCVICETEDDECEHCDCGGHTDECENSCAIPCATEIKTRLQKKFDEVIRQKKEENKERDFFQELKDTLLTMVVKKIVSEDYQSLTNDLNAEGAGIYVILSEQDTTNLEIRLRKRYSFDKPMNFDYLESEVINGIAGEVCEHLGFRDAIGYLDDKGQTIFKLWF